MGDLISRQAAIDETWREPRYADPLNVLTEVRERIRSLPSAQQEQRWIPVSERLPEKGQTCLVCDEGVIAIDKYMGIGNPLNWDWYDRDYEAWMPLPKPYKGEES